MKKYNYAIIGCGRIARRHAEIISKFGNLVKVYDVVKRKTDSLAEEFKCEAVSDIDDIYSSGEIDIITICTPNKFHAIQSIEALESGKHVICEKPMALNSEDCQRMIDASVKANKKLFVVKQNRFNPPVAMLKKVLDENKLGKINYAVINCFWNRGNEYYIQSDWKGRKESDGGTLFTQFSHFIDLIYWLIGDVKRVFSITKNYQHQGIIEFEDTGVAILEFENGVLGSINYTVNSHKKNMEGSITIFAEKGTVKIGGQYLNVLEYQSIDNYKIEGLQQSRPANDYGFYQGSMSNHEQFYENVIDVLNHNGQIAVSSYEGLKTVEIIEKIYKAAESYNR